MRLKNLIVQFTKFMLVGGIAFAAEMGSLILLHEVLGVPTVPASSISFVISLFVSYFLAMRHVFERRDSLSRTKELTIYFALGFVGLGLNTLLMWIAREAFISFGVAYEASMWYLVVKFGVTCIVGLWNFFSRRHWLDAQVLNGAC